MAWNPDSPFPSSAAVGETDSGARHLPAFLCSLLRPGSVLVVGASEVALQAALHHDVAVVDWSRRRLIALREAAAQRGVKIETICRDPERQDLGLPARSVANVVCVDVLERARSEMAVLDHVHRVLEPEGYLVARVRAGDWVREEAGRRPCAVRSYRPGNLRAALDMAGFRTVRIRHWNLLGIPSALLWDRCLGRPHRDPGGQPASERPVDGWGSMVDRWYRHVEGHVGFPAGVSLVAVATPHLERERLPERRLEQALPGSRREAYEPMASVRLSDTSARSA